MGSVLRLGMMFLLLSLLTLLACARAAPTATPTPAPAVAPTTTPTTAPAVAPTATPAVRIAPTATPAVVAAPTATRVALTPTPTLRAPRGVLNVIDLQRNEIWLPRHVSNNRAYAYLNDSLLNENPKTKEPLPGLAESWKTETKPDGKVDWTFVLRKGIQFHRGWGELTAEDYKFSLAQYMKTDSLSPAAGTFRTWYGNNADNIEVKDRYTFVVHAPEPNSVVMESIANATAGLPPMSKKWLESVGEDVASREPIGVGPFEMVEHKRGQFIRFRALTEHYRQVPYFAEVKVHIVLEPTTRIAMLRTGQVDIADFGAKFKSDVEKAGIRIIRNPNSYEIFGLFGGMFLTTRPKYDPTVPWAGANPLDERPRLVRQAINLAVDRKLLIEKLFLGEGTDAPVSFNFLGPGVAWWNPEWKPYPYDPKRARELLAQAGYPNGFKTKWYAYVEQTYTQDVAVAMASFLGDVGIETTIVSGEYRPTHRQRLVERSSAGWLYAHENAVSTPLSYACASGCCGGQSTAVIVHTEAPFWDELCPAMIKELEFSKRAALIRRLGDVMYQQYWTIPLATVNVLFGVGPKVDYWEPIPGAPGVYLLEYATPAK